MNDTHVQRLLEAVIQFISGHEKLQELTDDERERVLETLTRALKDANIQAEEVFRNDKLRKALAALIPVAILGVKKNKEKDLDLSKLLGMMSGDSGMLDKETIKMALKHVLKQINDLEPDPAKRQALEARMNALVDKLAERLAQELNQGDTSTLERLLTAAAKPALLNQLSRQEKELIETMQTLSQGAATVRGAPTTMNIGHIAGNPKGYSVSSAVGGLYATLEEITSGVSFNTTDNDYLGTDRKTILGNISQGSPIDTDDELNSLVDNVHEEMEKNAQTMLHRPELHH